MGNRKIVVGSSYSGGDKFGPYHQVSADDTVTAGSVILSGTLCMPTPTLSVTGSTIFSGAIGSLPTFTVAGPTSLSGIQDLGTPTLTITGSTILSGANGFLSTFTVAGPTVLSGTVCMPTPTLSVTGSMIMSGAVNGLDTLKVVNNMLLGPTIFEGVRLVVVSETLIPDAIETSMATVIPQGAIIRCVMANVNGNLTGGGTTVTWSLGITGDVDKYGTAGHPVVADSLLQNSKSTRLIVPVELSDNVTIKLCAAAAGGAAAGDTKLSGGNSVRVVVIYEAPVALANV